MPKISARHALTEDEFAFCRIYAAFGGKNAAEAFRRSHCVNIGGFTYLKDGAGKPIESEGVIDARECSKQGNALLAKAHIKEFLEELGGSSSDHARGTLQEQVLFGEDDAARLKAAQRVLDDEDKLGFRDAAEKHAEILSAIGAEVVVPIPGGGEVAFHAREMFPRYSEALPPRDVLIKTMKSLDQYLWMETGRLRKEERDPHDWKFLDGFNEYTTEVQRT